MNNDHKQIILNAISDGYLTIPANRDSILNLKHRLACLEQRLPAIQLLFAGGLTVIAADLTPLKYPDNLEALLWDFDLEFFKMSNGQPLIICPADQGKFLGRRLTGIAISQIDLEEHRQLVREAEENKLKSPFAQSFCRS